MKLDDVSGDDFKIEDRRGQGGGGGGFGFGRGGLPIPIGKGKGSIGVIVVMAIALFLGKSLLGGGGGGGGGIGDILNQMGSGQTASVDQNAPTQASGTTKDAKVQFVQKVGVLLNEYWAAQFEGSKQSFNPPRSLVVFDAPTPTGGCGTGTPEAGPFYCPGDEKIYIDLGFYQQLEKQLGFNGDFAEAYVIAHEYGHHIQNLLGINKEVQDQTRGASEAEANQLSVKLELQADCFAGAWGRSAYEQKRLDATDFNEAIGAAEAVGDDAIQSKMGGSVNQETFTHGSSADREKWFRTGFDSGDPSQCNTFG